MFNWIKRIFAKRADDVIVETDDPNIAKMVSECYKRGKPVRGRVNDDGELEIIDIGKEIPDSPA